MIDLSLCEKMLEAPMIIKGFVYNDPICNYEKYLTEIINCSVLFLDKSKGEEYYFIEKQDHGEDDAVSVNYSVDYKLFASKSSLQALRETSCIQFISGDICLIGKSRLPSGESFPYIRLMAALRNYSYDDFVRIRINPRTDIDKELLFVIKSLCVKKNILLFYPYYLFFSEKKVFENGIRIIEEALNDDLHELLLLREKEVPDYDTFFCTIYENNMLFFEMEKNTLYFKDNVELKLSRLFMELRDNYTDSSSQ